MKTTKEKESESVMVFKERDKVRIVLDKKPLEKRRSNLSREAYIIIGVSGNQYPSSNPLMEVSISTRPID